MLIAAVEKSRCSMVVVGTRPWQEESPTLPPSREAMPILVPLATSTINGRLRREQAREGGHGVNEEEEEKKEGEKNPSRRAALRRVREVTDADAVLVRKQQRQAAGW